jgi:predicted DNA-binding transcriptional regulator AlpA
MNRALAQTPNQPEAVGARIAAVEQQLQRLVEIQTELTSVMLIALPTTLNTKQVLDRLGLKDSRALKARWLRGHFPKPISTSGSHIWRLQDVLRWEQSR